MAVTAKVLGFGYEEIMSMEWGRFLEYHKEALEIYKAEIKALHG